MQPGWYWINVNDYTGQDTVIVLLREDGQRSYMKRGFPVPQWEIEKFPTEIVFNPTFAAFSTSAPCKLRPGELSRIPISGVFQWARVTCPACACHYNMLMQEDVTLEDGRQIINSREFVCSWPTCGRRFRIADGKYQELGA